MALETFDNGGSLDHLARVTEEQKSRARAVCAAGLFEIGYNSAEIIEVFDMLDIWPEGMRDGRRI